MRLFLIVAIGLAILWVLFKTLRGRAPGGTSENGESAFSGIPKDDLKRLRTICRGNIEQMTRLIEYEKARRPGIDNNEACRRAIASLSRDNR